MPGLQGLGNRPLGVSPDAWALAELPAVSHHPAVLSGVCLFHPGIPSTLTVPCASFQGTFFLWHPNIHHGEHFPDLGEKGDDFTLLWVSGVQGTTLRSGRGLNGEFRGRGWASVSLETASWLHFLSLAWREQATPSKDLKNVLRGEKGVSTGMEGNCQDSKNAFVIKKTSKKFSRRSESG